MVEVNLWSGLKDLTGGKTVVEVEGATIGAILDALVEAHPGLAPVIEAGVSVAVDGEIVTGNLFTEVPPGADVFLMQRLKGG